MTECTQLLVYLVFYVCFETSEKTVLGCLFNCLCLQICFALIMLFLTNPIECEGHIEGTGDKVTKLHEQTLFPNNNNNGNL